MGDLEDALKAQEWDMSVAELEAYRENALPEWQVEHQEKCGCEGPFEVMRDTCRWPLPLILEDWYHTRVESSP